jgi:hypothetical protein
MTLAELLGLLERTYAGRALLERVRGLETVVEAAREIDACLHDLYSGDEGDDTVFAGPALRERRGLRQLRNALRALDEKDHQ